MTKIEDIFDNKDDVRMDNWIWAFSILALLVSNNTDKEKPIINIFLGDE